MGVMGKCCLWVVLAVAVVFGAMYLGNKYSQELLVQCDEGNYDEALALLKYGAFTFGISDDGFTSLILCSGSSEVAFRILDKNPRLSSGEPSPLINFKHKDTGITALHMAAFRGNKPLVKRLLAEGAYEQRYGTTISNKNAITYAAERGHTDIIDAFFNYEIEVDGPRDELDLDGRAGRELIEALIGEHEETALRLIELGSLPFYEGPERREEVMAHGSALHVACGLGLPRAAIKLIEIGCDVNALHKGSATPLSILTAANSGDSEDMAKVVQALIDKGADIEHADDSEGGRTPLLLAIGSGFTKAVDLLLRAGANKEAKDRDGVNALAACDPSNKPDEIASFQPDEESCKVLLAHS
jgi:ankyrin repeat protein